MILICWLFIYSSEVNWGQSDETSDESSPLVHFTINQETSEVRGPLRTSMTCKSSWSQSRSGLAAAAAGTSCSDQQGERRTDPSIHQSSINHPSTCQFVFTLSNSQSSVSNNHINHVNLYIYESFIRPHTSTSHMTLTDTPREVTWPPGNNFSVFSCINSKSVPVWQANRVKKVSLFMEQQFHNKMLEKLAQNV